MRSGNEIKLKLSAVIAIVRVTQTSFLDNNFWVVSAGIASKLEKVGPTFSSFNPLPSFQTRGAGYKSVQHETHMVRKSTLRLCHEKSEFAVDRANIEQDTAIYINLKIYKRCMTCMVVRTSIYFFNIKFWSF